MRRSRATVTGSLCRERTRRGGPSRSARRARRPRRTCLRPPRLAPTAWRTTSCSCASATGSSTPSTRRRRRSCSPRATCSGTCARVGSTRDCGPPPPSPSPRLPSATGFSPRCAAERDAPRRLVVVDTVQPTPAKHAGNDPPARVTFDEPTRGHRRVGQRDRRCARAGGGRWAVAATRARPRGDVVRRRWLKEGRWCDQGGLHPYTTVVTLGTATPRAQADDGVLIHHMLCGRMSRGLRSSMASKTKFVRPGNERRTAGRTTNSWRSRRVHN